MDGMSTTPTFSPALGAERGRRQRLVHAAAAADDHGGIAGALLQHMALAELERVVAVVDDG